MSAAYTQILIHAVNAPLFLDAIPDATAWTGLPREIITVQSLIYASLAMLGKQWVSQYLRNRGGSAADKSRDRQRQLDRLERWHFQLVIESLPLMLQLGLLLLGCALSLYLWTISHTVAGVAMAVTLFGVASCLFFHVRGNALLQLSLSNPSFPRDSDSPLAPPRRPRPSRFTVGRRPPLFHEEIPAIPPPFSRCIPGRLEHIWLRHKCGAGDREHTAGDCDFSHPNF